MRRKRAPSRLQIQMRGIAFHAQVVQKYILTNYV
jgi:hypothetical protein